MNGFFLLILIILAVVLICAVTLLFTCSLQLGCKIRSKLWGGACACEYKDDGTPPSA